MNTFEEIEAALAEIETAPNFGKIVREYDRLLEIVGSVEDDKIIALVLFAEDRVRR